MKRFLKATLMTAIIVGFADMMLIMSMYTPKESHELYEHADHEIRSTPYEHDSVEEEPALQI